MHKNNSAEGSKPPQKTGLTADYKNDSKLLKLSSYVSGYRIAYPVPEQTSLFNQCTSFEGLNRDTNIWLEDRRDMEAL